MASADPSAGRRPLRVLEVAGARPNFVKIAPIHRAILERQGIEPIFLHTGQHYDPALSDTFLQELGLPAPDEHLGVGSGSHAEQTAAVMLAIEPILLDRRPDVVVVVGDVNSTLGAALAAVKLGVPIAHVEAGLRSFERGMPEEVNRKLVDAVADLLFVPSEDAEENLLREGVERERIRFVGNVMIDSLEAVLPRARQSHVLADLGLRHRGFGLATIHRASNVDDPASLVRVVDALRAAASVIPLVFPVHPRTRARLDGHASTLERAGVRLVEPCGYVDFVSLMSTAACVLTDSGGIQEETTVLGVPCLTLREATERPVTLTAGTNRLVGLDPDSVRRATSSAAAEEPSSRRPPLWDGHSARRIVDGLASGFAPRQP